MVRAAKHRFLATSSCLLTAALVTATLASGHPLDATDFDHDRFKNWADNCPHNYNPKQTDTDGDTAAPLVDQPAPHPSVGPVIVYPYSPATPPGTQQPLPTDRPPDTGGDSCDVDDDGDGITDSPRRDNCKLVANPDQADADGDGLGDACDTQNGAAVAAPGADPDDRRAPKLAVARLRAIRLGAVGRRLPVGVRCDEGCAIDGRLVVRRRPVARGAAQVAAKGRTWVFLAFSEKTMRTLHRARPRRATLRLVAQDANGNRTIVRKRLAVRR